MSNGKSGKEWHENVIGILAETQLSTLNKIANKPERGKSSTEHLLNCGSFPSLESMNHA